MTGKDVKHILRQNDHLARLRAEDQGRITTLEAELTEANESADKFCEQSLRDLGEAAKMEKQLAEARAEVERKNEALRRIADANVLDMNTLHPDGIQQEAREALATPAPTTSEAERHTFEPLLAPVEPARPWQHNYGVCKHCGKTEEACIAARQQESGE